MILSLHKLKSLAQAVAREYHPELTVIGVTRSEGGEDLVEIIVASAPPDAGPRMVSIPLSRRGAESEVRAAIVQGLERQFKTHQRVG